MRSCRACPLPEFRVSAQAIEGLVNVRGTLLTVLDGHVLLQQAREAEDEGAIVVVEVAGRRYGLGVGQVLDFLEVPEQSVAARTDLPGIDPRLVRRSGIRDNQHFILLDIDALFAPIIGADRPKATGELSHGAAPNHPELHGGGLCPTRSWFATTPSSCGR